MTAEVSSMTVEVSGMTVEVSGMTAEVPGWLAARLDRRGRDMGDGDGDGGGGNWSKYLHRHGVRSPNGMRQHMTGAELRGWSCNRTNELQTGLATLRKGNYTF